MSELGVFASALVALSYGCAKAFVKGFQFDRFLLEFLSFPFWAVLLITALCTSVKAVRASYLYRLSRTSHLEHHYNPTVLRAAAAGRAVPAFAPDRDITSATPTTPGRPVYSFDNV